MEGRVRMLNRVRGVLDCTVMTEQEFKETSAAYFAMKWLEYIRPTSSIFSRVTLSIPLPV
jgi:hypothetical protein